MRVGLLSTYPPLECGIGTYSENLNQALRGRGGETFVIGPEGSQGEGVHAAFRLGSSCFAPDVVDLATRLTPDVFHVQHEYGLYGPDRGIEVVDLLMRFRLASIPTVVTLHTVYDAISDRDRFVLGQILEHATATIVHECFQLETIRRTFGSGPDVRVIEHGVREVAPVPQAKEKLGLAGKHVILMLGYYRATKGFHKAVDFFPEVAARDPDAVLVVAGKLRNTEAREYRDAFLSQLLACPAADRVRVLRGQFPQHTFDTILSAADVVVLPYDLGAQSGIMAQCFAMRRPVVASSLPAFEALLARSGGGIAVERDADYAEAILKVLGDPALRRAIRSNLEHYVRTRAGWSRIAGEHEAVYREVAGIDGGPGRYVYFPAALPERAGRFPLALEPSASSARREEPVETLRQQPRIDSNGSTALTTMLSRDCSR